VGWGLKLRVALVIVLILSRTLLSRGVGIETLYSPHLIREVNDDGERPTTLP